MKIVIDSWGKFMGAIVATAAVATIMVGLLDLRYHSRFVSQATHNEHASAPHAIEPVEALEFVMTSQRATEQLIELKVLVKEGNAVGRENRDDILILKTQRTN